MIWPEEKDSTLSLIIDGETLKFGICEIVNGRRDVLTHAEEKNQSSHPSERHGCAEGMLIFLSTLGPRGREGILSQTLPNERNL